MLEPLFNCYVFVQTSDAEMLTIRMTDNVVNFVYWLGTPAVIDDVEIEIMKRFMNEYANVKLEKLPLDLNEMVKETGGVRINNKSNLVTFKNNTVKIELPSFGYMLLVELKNSNGEVTTSSNHSYAIIKKYLYAV